MKITIFKRLTTAYKIIGKNFNTWFSPIITAIVLSVLKIAVFTGMFLDRIFFYKINSYQLKRPIIIVGNPRSGTTFLHRYLIRNKIGMGGELWKLLYPSIILQKMVRPFLPLLEKISPTRHHSTVAHKTSLQSIETDDASIFFRFFDGFFLYGFIMSWADDDLFSWFDPKERDMSKRDYKWLRSIWTRTLIDSNTDRYIGKLFSVSTNVPSFLESFPDAKILYMVRDPLSVIPSGLSLVTGVLDKRFGFWNLPEDQRAHFINRLYKALIELQVRFVTDWNSGVIDRNRVMLVHFDDLMQNFDSLMTEIVEFVGHTPDGVMIADIQETAKKQREFKSKHEYDLSKFGLSKNQIKKDAKIIYDTFFNE
jgi:omega-hydroxy-beta-dihydromenaquinone-9 sulfotransferase